MIKNITIDTVTYTISKDPRDLFKDNLIMQRKCSVALDMMEDCLDYIYNLMKPHYPNVFKPSLYISDSKECNAIAYQGKTIIIFAGLIFQQADYIEQKYTPELLKRYEVFQNIPYEKALSGLRVYFWRYVLLHELYHIWNQHSLWKKIYGFDESGKLVTKIQIPVGTELITKFIQLLENSFEIEHVLTIAKPYNSNEIQEKLTQQALELDADSSAVCMLVNMMMRDMVARGILEDKKKEYIRNEIALIVAAIATAFSLFDGNAGAKFECLGNLENRTHPLPSIRMFYAEEIAHGCLSTYFSDWDDLSVLESEWQKVICDVEADFNGQVDMGQVFYYTAYTEKAQNHLCKLKHRMTDMHDTMKPLVLANFSEKLAEEDMEFLPVSVWFTEDGKCIRNWINPATGANYAIRSDRVKVMSSEKSQQPFVRQHPKIGANDPCPCGSTKKFKKCCRGNGRYD